MIVKIIIGMILLSIGGISGYILNSMLTQSALSDIYSTLYLREQMLIEQIKKLEAEKKQTNRPSAENPEKEPQDGYPNQHSGDAWCDRDGVYRCLIREVEK